MPFSALLYHLTYLCVILLEFSVYAQLPGDAIIYRTQVAACSNRTYNYSCENNYKIVVARGMNWAAMSDQSAPTETCDYSATDCHVQEKSNNFLDMLTQQCDYRTSCSFTVPEIYLPDCQQSSDYALLLFQCTLSLQTAAPPTTHTTMTSTPLKTQSTTAITTPSTAKTTTTIPTTAKTETTTIPTTAKKETTTIPTTAKTTTTTIPTTAKTETAVTSPKMDATEIVFSTAKSTTPTLPTSTVVRDPENDTVLQKIQVFYCTPGTYSFTCENPDHVIWFEKGVAWGVRPPDIPREERCLTVSEADCQQDQTNGQFIRYMSERCDYRNGCVFDVPSIDVLTCGFNRSDWLLVLFSCGMTSNPTREAITIPTTTTQPPVTDVETRGPIAINITTIQTSATTVPSVKSSTTESWAGGITSNKHTVGSSSISPRMTTRASQSDATDSTMTPLFSRATESSIGSTKTGTASSLTAAASTTGKQTEAVGSTTEVAVTDGTAIDQSGGSTSTVGSTPKTPQEVLSTEIVTGNTNNIETTIEGEHHGTSKLPEVITSDITAVVTTPVSRSTELDQDSSVMTSTTNVTDEGITDSTESVRVTDSLNSGSTVTATSKSGELVSSTEMSVTTEGAEATLPTGSTNLPTSKTESISLTTESNLPGPLMTTQSVTTNGGSSSIEVTAEDFITTATNTGSPPVATINGSTPFLTGQTNPFRSTEQVTESSVAGTVESEKSNEISSTNPDWTTTDNSAFTQTELILTSEQSSPTLTQVTLTTVGKRSSRTIDAATNSPTTEYSATDFIPTTEGHAVSQVSEEPLTTTAESVNGTTAGVFDLITTQSPTNSFSTTTLHAVLTDEESTSTVENGDSTTLEDTMGGGMSSITSIPVTTDIFTTNTAGSRVTTNAGETVSGESPSSTITNRGYSISNTDSSATTDMKYSSTTDIDSTDTTTEYITNISIEITSITSTTTKATTANGVTTNDENTTTDEVDSRFTSNSTTDVNSRMTTDSEYPTNNGVGLSSSTEENGNYYNYTSSITSMTTSSTTDVTTDTKRDYSTTSDLGSKLSTNPTTTSIESGLASSTQYYSTDPNANISTENSVTSDTGTRYGTSNVVDSSSSTYTLLHSTTNGLTTDVEPTITTTFTADVKSSFTTDVESSFTTGIESSFTTDVESSSTTDVKSSFTTDVESSFTTDVESSFTTDVKSSFATADDEASGTTEFDFNTSTHNPITNDDHLTISEDHSTTGLATTIEFDVTTNTPILTANFELTTMEEHSATEIVTTSQAFTTTENILHSLAFSTSSEGQRTADLTDETNIITVTSPSEVGTTEYLKESNFSSLTTSSSANQQSTGTSGESNSNSTTAGRSDISISTSTTASSSTATTTSPVTTTAGNTNTAQDVGGTEASRSLLISELPWWVWLVCAVALLLLSILIIGAVYLIYWRRRVAVYNSEKARKRTSTEDGANGDRYDAVA